jgi:hypothetical protein
MVFWTAGNIGFTGGWSSRWLNIEVISLRFVPMLRKLGSWRDAGVVTPQARRAPLRPVLDHCRDDLLTAASSY